jgi:hypothetical protein
MKQIMNMIDSVVSWIRKRSAECSYYPLTIEIGIACLIISSAITTFAGSRALMNRNLLVALFFTAGIQLSLYGLAHSISGTGKRMNRGILMLAWFVPASFSIFTSAAGVIDLKLAGIKRDQARQQVADQWKQESRAVLDFQANSRSWITQNKVENRLRQMHYDRIAPFLDAIPNLPGALPESVEEARSMLDSAYASVRTAYSQMPSRFRAQFPLPQRAEYAPKSDDLFMIALSEIENRSRLGMMALAIAFLLDFVPVLLIFAHREVADISQKIYSIRLWIQRFKESFVKALPRRVRFAGTRAGKSAAKASQKKNVYLAFVSRDRSVLKGFLRQRDPKTSRIREKSKSQSQYVN